MHNKPNNHSPSFSSPPTFLFRYITSSTARRIAGEPIHTRHFRNNSGLAFSISSKLLRSPGDKTDIFRRKKSGERATISRIRSTSFFNKASRQAASNKRSESCKRIPIFRKRSATAFLPYSFTKKSANPSTTCICRYNLFTLTTDDPIKSHNNFL